MAFYADILEKMEVDNLIILTNLSTIIPHITKVLHNSHSAVRVGLTYCWALWQKLSVGPPPPTYFPQLELQWLHV